MRFYYRLSSDKQRLKAMQLKDAVYYVSNHITNVQVGAEALEVEAVDVDEEEFQARLDRFMRVGMLSRYAADQYIRDNREKVSRIKPASSAYYDRVGGLRLDGEMVLLEHAFDDLFRALAVEQGAALRRYPSFLTAEQMHNCGYLTHFPQHIYGLSEVEHEEDQLKRYRAQSMEHKQAGAGLVHNGLYLQPCLCFHVYEELAQAEHGRGEMELYTAAGACYRHEHRNRLSGTRLREFKMREIVYVGHPERVVQARDRLIEQSWLLFEELGLRGYVVSATDPFYFEEDSVLKYYQSSSALKYELRFAPDKQQDFSIASYNLCGHVLCEAFGVQGGEEIHSGCTGFGLDRWIQAFLAVHGRNVKQWPAVIQNRLPER